MNLRFSIITVCYNSEKTIIKTLESLLDQTYKDYELILIDGGSQDGTLEIINRYKNRFEQITIVSESDHGIYDAMNKGIRLSSGDLIAFLNSDDYYEKDALKHIAKSYSFDIDIIYGDCYLIDDLRGSSFKKKIPIKELITLKERMAVPHPSTFVRRELMLSHLFDASLRIGADYKFILNMFLQEKKFKYIPYPITNMLVGGISSTQTIQCLEEFVIIQKELLHYTTINMMKMKMRYSIYTVIKKFLFNIAPKSISFQVKRILGWKKMI